MAQKPGETRPVVMCEYAHSMGNSTGNLREYWDIIHHYPRVIGGFIWDWVDQGLRQYTDDGEAWFAYGGDFGEKWHDGSFCLNGLISPEAELLSIRPASVSNFTRSMSGTCLIGTIMSITEVPPSTFWGVSSLKYLPGSSFHRLDGRHKGTIACE